MSLNKFTEITRKLISLTDDEGLFEQIEENSIQPFVVLKPSKLLLTCEHLHQYPDFFFDTLSCISAIDNGADEENRFEVIYHLYSLLHEEQFIIKVYAQIDRDGVPNVPSLNSIWKTADWHEREAYDLMGINFTNHPDLRRILLPADWEGHPLRKDYKEQETYHGIKVKYE